MNNKNALVTGSSSGIGFSIANKLAASGYRVALHGLEDELVGEKIAQDLSSKYAVDCAYFQADLSIRAECEALLPKVVEAGFAPDVLVNNAGFQHTAHASEFPNEVWEKMIAVNLSAPQYLSKDALKGMMEKNYGRVINIASVHGLVASANKAAYCAAKHGLVGLTKVAAIDCAEHDITVNAICPGWVETDLAIPQFEAIATSQGISYDEAKRQLVSQKQPKPECTSVEAIGALVLFLLSDAARTITGTALPIDGGWVAQ